MTKSGMHPDFAFEVSHIGTLLGMVEAGLGLAAVPRMALPVNHAAVIGLPLRQPTISRSLGPVAQTRCCVATRRSHVP